MRNGDFLVRDSLAGVGDYVLTCRWDNEVLHFKISKVLVKSNETKVCVKALAGTRRHSFLNKWIDFYFMFCASTRQ